NDSKKYSAYHFLPFLFRRCLPSSAPSTLPTSAIPSDPSPSSLSFSSSRSASGFFPSAFLASSTSLTIFLPSSISPFAAPHPIHFHTPTSLSALVPGGACPLTSRHRRQMSTMRFLAAVSSSPRRRSMILSYQCVSPGGPLP